MDQPQQEHDGRTAFAVFDPRAHRGLVAVAAVAIWGAVPSSASASVSTRQSVSTRGVIVWTDRTDAGDHLMIGWADGSHARSLTHLGRPERGPGMNRLARRTVMRVATVATVLALTPLGRVPCHRDEGPDYHHTACTFTCKDACSAPGLNVPRAGNS